MLDSAAERGVFHFEFPLNAVGGAPNIGKIAVRIAAAYEPEPVSEHFHAMAFSRLERRRGSRFDPVHAVIAAPYIVIKSFFTVRTADDPQFIFKHR